MKQFSIQNGLILLTLAVLVVAGATVDLVAAPDKAPEKGPEKGTNKDSATQIVGTYTGDGVTLTVEWEKGQPRGVIVTNEQSFPFTGKPEGKGIKGIFRNGGVAIDFTATMAGDQLTFTSGATTYKLKKRARVQVITGTYQSGTNSISIAETNGKYTGFIDLGGKRSAITATKQGQRVVGHYAQDGKQYPFSATLDGDLLTVALGIEQIKMRRFADAGHGVQSKRKVFETVLAKSADAIDATILVSPDNRKVAFTTRRPDRFAYQFWINGKPQQSDAESYGMRFSADGRRFAHLMKKGDEHFVVIDDKPSDPYSEVIVHAGVFSEDGKRSIFAGRSGTPWRIVVDGKPGPPFNKLNIQYGFSANGQRFAYIGGRSGKWHVVVDGELSPAYEAVLMRWQLFSEDSKHVQYAIVRNGKQVPIVDGKELDEHDAITDMRFSPAGDRHAYIALDGDASRVIVDGVAGRQYERIGRLKFSPDGKSLAFPVRIDGKSGMVVNEKRTGELYDRVSSPKFSPDGQHVLFLAQVKDREFKSKQFMVIDGKRSTDYDEIRSAKFSPDSQRVGFIARKDDLWFVVVDGIASYPYPQEPGHLTFSPDSKHVVFVAKRDQSTYVIVDGTESKPIWPLLPGSTIVFDDAKRFSAAVQRSDEFIRLDIEIVE